MRLDEFSHWIRFGGFNFHRSSCLPRQSCAMIPSVTEGRGFDRAMTKPSDLVQGTLDLLILKILALQPLHGWALGQRLKPDGGRFRPILAQRDHLD